MNEYELLDSGHGRKLERFGKVTLDRPCAQAVWNPANPQLWKQADAFFTRKQGLEWRGRDKLPDSWIAEVNGVKMKLSTTDFGHLGVFPETRDMWDWIRDSLGKESQRRKEPLNFLNLFAYSGGATLAAAQGGAHCCHVDASKGMVAWARENAKLNGLAEHPVRWIVDDVNKFLTREIKRGRRYDAILLDPPSFGRGKGGELYKIEHALLETLKLVQKVMSDKPCFVYLTSHTPGFTPIVLKNLIQQLLGNGQLDCGEMLLTGQGNTFSVPSGTWARWEK
ncbi:class I SAM-dependent methyltransferase [Coraliomargarita sp. SDUM461003]|uniref:Class I SAM-dependent methyltransferase n=1 Tax=Thalassobacterium maritimum TaxID=3041265 RepID=A0ABU1ASE0_9BACT|nr:class I SAM-dependent methyltransferase [Coraliomargarita sp. SDUM461003]MDQ8207076.1 class I SAM-dependent methyltransferase [Coraliomargarita sp. SDUM461003]